LTLDLSLACGTIVIFHWKMGSGNSPLNCELKRFRAYIFCQDHRTTENADTLRISTEHRRPFPGRNRLGLRLLGRHRHHERPMAVRAAIIPARQPPNRVNDSMDEDEKLQNHLRPGGPLRDPLERSLISAVTILLRQIPAPVFFHRLSK
jgi:hypothetical protein